MRWDAAIAAMLARVEADADLLALLGGLKVFRTVELRDPQPTQVAYTVITSPRGENQEDVLVQWDVWAPDTAALVAIERRLRTLLHRQIWADVPGVGQMAFQYVDRRDHDDSEPGIAHSSLDFELAISRIR